MTRRRRRERAPARLTRRGRRVVVAGAALLVLAGGAWTVTGGPLAPDPVAKILRLEAVPKPIVWEPLEAAPLTTDAPLADRVVEADDVGTLARRLAEVVVARAPIVVTIPAANGASRRVGADLAGRLQAPLLVDVDLADLPEGWETHTLVSVDGDTEADGVLRVSSDGTDLQGPDAEQVGDLLGEATPAGTRRIWALLVDAEDEDVVGLAAVTAALAGGHVVTTEGGDLRGDDELRQELTGKEEPIVLAGRTGRWDDLDTVAWQLDVVRAGHELPGGGQLLFPDRRLVALYGSPGAPSLGVIGEQPLETAIKRAAAQAAQYDAHSDVPVIPTFEIIATVAAAEAGDDGDYSRPVPLDVVTEWVDAAGEAGVYVVLDLQPGRTDFLTQAKMFESLLTRPHVGLALDPEWRLKPDQVHLRQIGSVHVDEVNAVAEWLAQLTREHALPQKLLLLHQFRLSMIQERHRVVAPPELAVAIQMDGQGPQDTKNETWRALTTTATPEGVWWGWKNFHDEDDVLRSPADTLAIEPPPYFVSYQ